MNHFDQAFIKTPREEFEQFALSRIEGLAMREGEDQVRLYREALALGLEWLGVTNADGANAATNGAQEDSMDFFDQEGD